MSRKKLNDGLTNTQRYRLKDLETYRKRKSEYVKTLEQREKRTAYMRLWREKNREKHNQQSKESQHRNKYKHIDRNRNAHLLRMYGITLEDKNKMIALQNNKCLICEKEFKNSRSTHLDHCHITGKVRGILCHVCNTKLAWYETYSNNIVNYLNKQNQQICLK